MRALLSVTDKTGIVEFGQGLIDLGFELISTGGTGRTLAEAGVPFIPIEEVTGTPECMDDRLKTLGHKTAGGILADRDKPSHMEDAARLDISMIDMVVCNFYPFEQTVAQPGVTVDQATSKVDVGGPTMVRAAAKNAEHVWVVVDHRYYRAVLTALEAEPGMQRKMRNILRKIAFEYLAADAIAVATYFSQTPTEIDPEAHLLR